MAVKSNANVKNVLNRRGTGKRTSIGLSKFSSPKNKSTRRSFKKYRGQGK